MAAASAPLQTALCDEMARAIRRDAGLVAGKSERSVLETLTGGARPTVTISTKPDFRWSPKDAADESAGLAAFRKRYGGSTALVAGLEEFPTFSTYDVYSVGRGLNVMVNFAGSAGCESFHFFRITDAGEADVLGPPALPLGGMEYCMGGTGRPARIAGRTVFLSYFPDFFDHSEAFRVNPLSGTSWERGCSMSVTFVAPRYVADARPLSRSSLTNAQLADIGLRIAEGPALDDGYGFIKFGRSSADGDADKARRLRRLAMTFEDSATGSATAPVPGFPGIQTPHAQFIVVDGRTLVTVSGQAGFGWRTFRQFVVIVFDLVEGAARPIGVATIDTRRGRLLGIEVVPHDLAGK